MFFSVHFLRIQFFASSIWSLIFLIIGYIFGSVAITVTQRLERLALIAVLFLLTVAVIVHIVGSFIEIKEQKNKE